jgi:pyruvate/2-oxoglutarate dehydrogenase complex dihydrolipoamide dehydrogenase (E3) component
MMAAITAAERGHDVTLCERSGSLGGALDHADGVYFKSDLSRFNEYLVRRVGSLPIAVLLDTEVTPETLALSKPEVVVVSVGAEPIIPDIPGIDGAGVLLATQAHSPDAPVGHQVVVVGGGQVGCETALHLARRGSDVTIVEMLDEVAPDANAFHRTALLLELRKNVEVRTGLRCVEITDSGVVAVDKNGGRVCLDCDTVVIAVGYRPRKDVVDALRSVAPDVMPVGDCVKPQKVMQAVHAGYDAGMAI